MAGALAIAALVVGAADVVKAAGTTAGTTVSNTATVNYTVSAVAQPAITATADFVVDRRIDMTLTAPLTYVTVTPATNGAIPFTLTNTSNASLNFNLSAANNATDPYSGTDNFNPTTLSVFVDANANGTYEPLIDTATSVDTLIPDTPRVVFIVGAIPGGQANASIAAVTMTVTARETTANGGGALTNDAGADVAATMQTVFADGAGDTDALHDAAFSDTGAFMVQGANVSVTKTEQVLSDPVNGVSPNAKHIPGAVVRYTVTVANAAGVGAVAATSVSVSDILPVSVTFQPNTFGAGQGIELNAVAQTNAADSPTDESDYNGGTRTVSVTVPSLAPGSSAVIIFEVTVN